MGEFKVTPTGCPGPIPGSKVWRCDGASCVYGWDVDACAKAIKERGYELRISSDLAEDMRLRAEAVRETALTQLQETNRLRRSESIAHEREMDQARISIQTQEVELLRANQRLDETQASLQDSEKALAEHKAALSESTSALEHTTHTLVEAEEALLDSTAQTTRLRDELRWYKMKEESYAATEETGDTAGDTVLDSGSAGDGAGVRGAGADTGTVTEE